MFRKKDKRPKMCWGTIEEHRQDMYNRKDELRKEMAKLPLEKKIEILIELQKIAKVKHKDYPVWKI